MTLCFVSFALLLTAISGGMFLLAKTNKDNLGNFFRFVSWFVIVSGFLGILLCAAMCMCRMCCHGGGMHRHHRMMSACSRGGCEEEMMNEGGNQRIIIKKFGGDEMECPGMHGKCDPSSGPGGSNCCKGGDQEKNMEIKKDTIIIKK